MTFTPRKVTSRTPDCARRTRSMRDRINQWKYVTKLIHTCVAAQFNRAVGLPSFS